SPQGRGVTPLGNGNYVVTSASWGNRRGATTWADGTTGISGEVGPDNSLVGLNPGNSGTLLLPLLLSNGNFIIRTQHWNGNRGAVTWADGAKGITGVIGPDNSFVGDGLGTVGSGGVFALANGNYVVSTPGWNFNTGAVTWADGLTGLTGTIEKTNSLLRSEERRVGKSVELGGRRNIKKKKKRMETRT